MLVVCVECVVWLVCVLFGLGWFVLFVGFCYFAGLCVCIVFLNTCLVVSFDWCFE